MWAIASLEDIRGEEKNKVRSGIMSVNDLSRKENETHSLMIEEKAWSLAVTIQSE